MANTTQLTVRVDTEILAIAENLLATHGLTAQEYIRMAMARVAHVGGIPWDTASQQLAVTNIKRAGRKSRTPKATPAQSDELREGLGSE